MENNTTNVSEIVEAAVEALPVPVKDKPSVWAIAILVLAGIGLGSSVYFSYKGIKYIATKLKDGSVKVKKVPEKKQEKAEEAKKEVAAEEVSEEE